MNTPGRTTRSSENRNAGSCLGTSQVIRPELSPCENLQRNKPAVDAIHLELPVPKEQCQEPLEKDGPAVP